MVPEYVPAVVIELSIENAIVDVSVPVPVVPGTLKTGGQAAPAGGAM